MFVINLRAHTRAPGLVFVCTLLLLACSGADSQRASPSPGNPAPEYSAHSLAGQEIALADLRGDVVVLNVWATWCGPCVREMPALEALHRRLGERGLRVVGASLDRGSAEDAVRSFVAERDITFTILLDPDQQVSTRFLTIGVPETFLIDRNGIIAHRWIGEFDPMAQSELQRVEALLSEDGSGSRS